MSFQRWTLVGALWSLTFGCSQAPAATASAQIGAADNVAQSEPIAKERAAIPEPAAVSLEGVRYEALPWGKPRGLPQNGGYVVAIDETTEKEKWIVKVYDVPYDRDMEQDKQDVFITRLTLQPADNTLRVVNERGAVYLLNLDTRAITGPLPGSD